MFYTQWCNQHKHLKNALPKTKSKTPLKIARGPFLNERIIFQLSISRGYITVSFGRLYQLQPLSKPANLIAPKDPGPGNLLLKEAMMKRWWISATTGDWYVWRLIVKERSFKTPSWTAEDKDPKNGNISPISCLFVLNNKQTHGCFEFNVC